MNTNLIITNEMTLEEKLSVIAQADLSVTD